MGTREAIFQVSQTTTVAINPQLHQLIHAFTIFLETCTCKHRRKKAKSPWSLDPVLTGFLDLWSSSWALRNSCSKELASSLNRPTSSQFFRKRVGVGVWSGGKRTDRFRFIFLIDRQNPHPQKTPSSRVTFKTQLRIPSSSEID